MGILWLIERLQSWEKSTPFVANIVYIGVFGFICAVFYQNAVARKGQNPQVDIERKVLWWEKKNAIERSSHINKSSCERERKKLYQ